MEFRRRRRGWVRTAMTSGQPSAGSAVKIVRSSNCLVRLPKLRFSAKKQASNKVEGCEFGFIRRRIVLGQMSLERTIFCADDCTPETAASVHSHTETFRPNPGVAVGEGPPPSSEPSLPLPDATPHFRFSTTCRRRVSFHVSRTDTADTEDLRVVWVFHVMDVADCPRFTHFTVHLRLPQILNADASPAVMGDAGLRPLSSL